MEVLNLIVKDLIWSGILFCGGCFKYRGWSSIPLHRGHSMNYTYMLRCSDGTLYTGWTNNLEKRVSTHNKGKGGKYTRCRVPVELVYYECFDTKEEAMSREAAIKQLTRRQKEKLIEEYKEMSWRGQVTKG